MIYLGFLLLHVALISSHPIGGNSTSDEAIFKNIITGIKHFKRGYDEVKSELKIASSNIERLYKMVHDIKNKEEEKETEENCSGTWFLGMNLNPDDGHIMGYRTGWDDGDNIGDSSTAFTNDYLSKDVWNMAVDKIAIVRHQQGSIDAVKVWKFEKEGRSMLDIFKAMDPGREILTKGGPKQVYMVRNMKNNEDDPIFSVSGDIAVNWWYSNNANRIVLTGGHLSEPDVNDDNTHGLGNSYNVEGKTGIGGHEYWAHEISNIQDCPFPTCPREDVKIQGGDHGNGVTSGPVYGNYAIYVSKEAEEFPTDKKLGLEMKDLGCRSASENKEISGNSKEIFGRYRFLRF